jgi:hypothetical protein
MSCSRSSNKRWLLSKINSQRLYPRMHKRSNQAIHGCPGQGKNGGHLVSIQRHAQPPMDRSMVHVAVGHDALSPAPVPAAYSPKSRARTRQPKTRAWERSPWFYSSPWSFFFFFMPPTSAWHHISASVRPLKSLPPYPSTGSAELAIAFLAFPSS